MAHVLFRLAAAGIAAAFLLAGCSVGTAEESPAPAPAATPGTAPPGQGGQDAEAEVRAQLEGSAEALAASRAELEAAKEALDSTAEESITDLQARIDAIDQQLEELRRSLAPEETAGNK